MFRRAAAGTIGEVVVEVTRCSSLIGVAQERMVLAASPGARRFKVARLRYNVGGSGNRGRRVLYSARLEKAEKRGMLR